MVLGGVSDEFIRSITVEDIRRWFDVEHLGGPQAMRLRGPCLLVIIAVAAVLLGTMHADAKDGNFGRGDGTPSNPYVIEDAQDLQGMSGDLGAHYVLGNDIDASETAMWNSGAGFEPVGTKENNFTGTLDGANNKIRGFYIYRRDTHNVGLFGYIGKDGIVRDVDMSYNRVHAQNRVGGLAGVNEGAILNCSAMGNLTYGLRGVGGLVGNNYGTVSDCNFMGNINGRYNTGGLVGYNTGWVSSCHVEGNVTGEDDVGGLVGSNLGTVSRSHATANVTGTQDSSSYVGGLVGGNSYGATVSDCYASGNVSGAERVGGLLGSQNGKVHRSYYNIDSVLINGGNHVTMWGLFDAQYQDWFSNGFSLDISDYSGSLIPTAGSYEIRDVQGLRDLLGFSHVDEYRFYLATDIDLSSAPGLYIPYLRAEFDGDNHTISGLRIDLPFAAHVGMFGINAQGTIANLGLEDVNVTGSWYVGGLAGSSGGNVSNSYVIGIVNGSRCVGGLVGSNSDPLTSCYAKATVIGVSYHVGTGGTGGLVGHNYDGPISNCYATGNVTGGNEVGGLIGSNGGNVSDCYATGRVNGSRYVGGLVGDHTRRTITNSYATGNVIGRRSYTGGLVGRMSGGMVSESFWDKESSGLETSDGGQGRSTLEMKNRSTFADAGWDFDNIWLIIENVTYPLLQWQDRGVPTAHAGPDIIVEEDTDVFLNGTGSSDDIGIVKYEWTLNDGYITTLCGAQITYMFEDPGVFVVMLNVTDGAGKWDTDEFSITVRDVTPPIADAGPDQFVDQGTLVNFDGSGSEDNVAVVNFTWTLHADVPVKLHSESPTYRFDTPGKYKVTLNISDAAGRWSTDMMNVTVRDISPPVADAGEDNILDQYEVAHFDGSNSTDNVGITNWTWYFEYDGEDKMLVGDIIPFTFYIPGHYTVTLKVLDAESNPATDIVNVTVRDIIAPIANAGEDVEVDQREEVELDASASTDNVGLVNWTWTFEDVGEPVHLYGKVASHTFTVAGMHEVTLVVTDADGNNATAKLVVTVQDITPPTAVEGGDIIIGQGEEFTLDGAASTDDVGIVDWVWTVELDGKIVEVLVGSVVDYSLKEVGLYTTELRIRDLAGNNATAMVAITVQDTEAPVAIAGEETSIKPGGTVELDGGTSTDNIGVVSWVWTVKGSDAVIEGPVVNITFDEAGEYIVRLTVTDAAGNVDDATVRVVVSDIETSDSGLLIIAVIAISIVVCILGFVLYLRNR